MERVVIVGSGGLAYREYSFEALAARYELLAVLPEEPTWQQPYLTDHRVVAGPDDVLEAVGLPHMSPEAARNCRDKHATRSAMAVAGLSAVRFALVHTEEEAVERSKTSTGPHGGLPNVFSHVGSWRHRSDASPNGTVASPWSIACEYSFIRSGRGGHGRALRGHQRSA